MRVRCTPITFTFRVVTPILELETTIFVIHRFKVDEAISNATEWPTFYWGVPTIVPTIESNIHMFYSLLL
jgi:hypothetical protein